MITRTDVAIVLGLAGFGLAGGSLFVALAAKKETTDRWTAVSNMIKSDEDNIGGQGQRVTDLKEAHEALSQKVSRLAGDPQAAQAVWDAIHDLQSRTAVIEKRLQIERPSKDK